MDVAIALSSELAPSINVTITSNGAQKKPSQLIVWSVKYPVPILHQMEANKNEISVNVKEILARILLNLKG